MAKPCIKCGEPTTDTRCADCAPVNRALHRTDDHKLTTAQRGYGTPWAKLSRRARRMQPWCLDCGTRDDLTVDHTPEAWARYDAGKPIRITDVEVVCRSCNSKRGPGRTRGVTPPEGGVTGRGEARRALHTPGGYL